jgi:hypothetical protein
VAPDAPEKIAVDLALQVATVVNALEGKTPSKIIYKEGKILNLIAK